jgi:hypothetical protein
MHCRFERRPLRKPPALARGMVTRIRDRHHGEEMGCSRTIPRNTADRTWKHELN